MRKARSKKERRLFLAEREQRYLNGSLPVIGPL
jgi:hypothetical protein